MYTPELIITVLENAVFCESVERNRLFAFEGVGVVGGVGRVMVV